ncbi:hypothetical protein [Nonomuraea dietziae]|uniref:hypothetical protein n=1 Tax=Nonomuraea dietziae TaxID=65515 RepID=UPI0031DD67DE
MYSRSRETCARHVHMLEEAGAQAIASAQARRARRRGGTGHPRRGVHTIWKLAEIFDLLEPLAHADQGRQCPPTAPARA